MDAVQNRWMSVCVCGGGGDGGGGRFRETCKRKTVTIGVRGECCSNQAPLMAPSGGSQTFCMCVEGGIQVEVELMWSDMVCVGGLLCVIRYVCVRERERLHMFVYDWDM